MEEASALTRRGFLAEALGAAGTLGAGAALLAGRPARAGQAAPAPVEMARERTVLEGRLAGRPVFVYNHDTSHAGLYRPFFHPLMGPHGRPITQNGEFPGTLRGHYWHRALFIAHQKVNGLSFWEERAADCGKIVHLGFEEGAGGPLDGFVQKLAWRDLTGADVLRETRAARLIPAGEKSYFLDLSLNLAALGKEVLLAATPYNLLACRVIDAMVPLPLKETYRKKYGPLVDFAPLDAGGRITNSEGKEDDACRGAKARWCDFSGPLGDGTTGGVALLDHPANPRHPTPWHNWNNMTITASFTFHEPYTLKEGADLFLRYRVYVHSGDARQAEVEAVWKAFGA